MKIKIFIISFFYFSFLFHQLNAFTNKIIIKVENEIITNYEVRNKILTSLILAGERVTQENIDKFSKLFSRLFQSPSTRSANTYQVVKMVQSKNIVYFFLLNNVVLSNLIFLLPQELKNYFHLFLI